MHNLGRPQGAGTAHGTDKRQTGGERGPGPRGTWSRRGARGADEESSLYSSAINLSGSSEVSRWRPGVGGVPWQRRGARFLAFRLEIGLRERNRGGGRADPSGAPPLPVAHISGQTFFY